MTLPSALICRAQRELDRWSLAVSRLSVAPLALLILGGTRAEGSGATAVRIGLLGGFEVSEGDRTVAHGAWRLRKAKTLVKLLALEPAHRLHRELLVDQLWPDLDPDAARNNLHQALHAARRALSTIGVDGADALALRDDLVVLAPDGRLVTDIDEFEDAVEQASVT